MHPLLPRAWFPSDFHKCSVQEFIPHAFHSRGVQSCSLHVHTPQQMWANPHMLQMHVHASCSHVCYSTCSLHSICVSVSGGILFYMKVCAHVCVFYFTCIFTPLVFLCNKHLYVYGSFNSARVLAHMCLDSTCNVHHKAWQFTCLPFHARVDSHAL